MLLMPHKNAKLSLNQREEVAESSCQLSCEDVLDDYESFILLISMGYYSL